MTTNLYPGQCPLCGRHYRTDAMVHHLSLGHLVNLDLYQHLTRKNQLRLLQMKEHLPYLSKRVQNES